MVVGLMMERVAARATSAATVGCPVPGEAGAALTPQQGWGPFTQPGWFAELSLARG